MKIYTLVITLILITSILAGCTERIDETITEKNEERDITVENSATDNTDIVNADENSEITNITQEDCDEREGTWYEERNECHTNDDREDNSEITNITQEDCELRKGVWTEAPGREGQYYCDYNEDERNETTTNNNEWFQWTMNGTHESIMNLTYQGNWTHLIVTIYNESGNITTPSWYNIVEYEEDLVMNHSWLEEGWHTANITLYDSDIILEISIWRFWVGHYCNQPNATGCED